MRELYYIRNHRADSTQLGTPSQAEPAPDKYRGKENKPARMRWLGSPDTDHFCFSGFEGVNPNRRINKDLNPVYRMRAFVADYDCPNLDIEQTIKDIFACDKLPFLPNEISYSLSKGIRMVWYPETPRPMCQAQAKAFGKAMQKALHLDHLARMLDEKALGDPSKTYEVGYDWRQISDTPMSDDFVTHWIIKSTKSTDLFDRDVLKIPLDRVRDELVKKYPNFDFPDPFVEKQTRFRRFWDEDAKDESAVVVLDGGLYCRTGEDGEGIIPWDSDLLLGYKFMKQFLVEQTGGIVNRYWYSGSGYISKTPDTGEWMFQKEGDLRLWLNSTDVGLSKAGSKGNPSEVDNVVYQIQKVHSVYEFAPFVYMPDGPMRYNGREYINTSTLKALAPSEQRGEWSEYFPFLAKLFEGLFPNEFERNVVLAWWKRFYKGAYEQKPTRGQALFIAGPTECGKTLLNRKVFGASAGGWYDGTSYYYEGAGFTGGMFELGFHCIDDGSLPSRQDAQSKLAERYKRIAANDSLSVEEKYQPRKMIIWNGRNCTTLNSDADSIQTMPQLQDSLFDKMILVKAYDTGDLIPNEENAERTIKQELPHMLRWLLDWTPPEEVLTNSRFGVVSHANKSLIKAIKDNSVDSIFFDVLDIYFAELREEDKLDENKPIAIPRKVLFERLSACEAVKASMRQFKSYKHIHHILQRALEDPEFKVNYVRRAAGMCWVFEPDYRPIEGDYE